MRFLKMFGSVFGLFQQSQSADEIISPEELKNHLDTGSSKALIDVRTIPEYSQSRIPGARNVPLDNLGALLNSGKGANDEIIVYCRTQNRSAMAARALSQHGFKNVKVLSGGITGWSQKGFPLEN